MADAGSAIAWPRSPTARANADRLDRRAAWSRRGAHLACCCRRIDYLPPVKRAAIDAFFNFPPGMSPGRGRRARWRSRCGAPRARTWRAKSSRAQELLHLDCGRAAARIGARVVDPIADRRARARSCARRSSSASRTRARSPRRRAVRRLRRLGALDRDPPAAPTSTRCLRARRAAQDVIAREDFPGANVQRVPERSSGPSPSCASCPTTAASRSPAGRAPLSAPWCAPSATAPGSANTSTATRRLIILRAEGGTARRARGRAARDADWAAWCRSASWSAIDPTLAPTVLRRVDRRRTVALNVDPPPAVAGGGAGHSRREVDAAQAAAAARRRRALRRQRRQFGELAPWPNFAMALLVLFLLMAALFRSAARQPFVMLTVPLALFGGVVGLRVLGPVTPQPLDLLR